MDPATHALVIGDALAEQQTAGLRGIVTVLGTLAFVGACFAAVELLDRRGAGSTQHVSVGIDVVDDEPVDDVWPLRGAGRPTARHPVPTERLLVASLVGSFVALGVALALIPLRRDVGLSSIALALVLVVVGAAAAGGRVAAAVTSAVAALSFNFVHTAPLYTFHIASTSNVVTSVLMIVIGVAVGEVAVRRVGHHRSRAAITSDNNISNNNISNNNTSNNNTSNNNTEEFP